MPEKKRRTAVKNHPSVNCREAASHSATTPNGRAVRNGAARSRPAAAQAARVESVTVGDVEWLIGEMQKDGLAGWTIRGHLTPLSSVMAYAVRKAWPRRTRSSCSRSASDRPSLIRRRKCSARTRR